MVWQDGADISHTTIAGFKGIFIDFLLSLWTGKCWQTNFRTWFPILLLMLLEYGCLKMIVFCFTLFFIFLSCLSASSLTRGEIK